MKFELTMGYHLIIILNDPILELCRIISEHDNTQKYSLLITVTPQIKFRAYGYC